MKGRLKMHSLKRTGLSAGTEIVKRLDPGGEIKMRFEKIKLTREGKVQVEYETKHSKGGTDEYSFSCADEPKSSFRKAMDDLAPDVVEMCELPEDYLNRIHVAGVSFSYGGENETMGAVIIAQMVLEKSNLNLNLNTPHKISEFYGETGDERQLLNPDCVMRLEKLIAEASDYVKGIRAQGNLFDQKVAT